MIIHSPFLSLEPYPEVPLHHMLAQAAAKAPGRAALITAEGQMLTYRRQGAVLPSCGPHGGGGSALRPASDGVRSAP